MTPAKPEESSDTALPFEKKGTVRQAAQKNRSTLFVEDGLVLSIEPFPGSQYIMRVRAPKCAAAANPGSFVHVTCDAKVPMRRPLSIMRAEGDWIEFLYKTVGEGLRLLSRAGVGKTLSLIGPIGQPFTPSPNRPKTLLIGGGVGIPPMIFLADQLRKQNANWQPLAILGSEIPFPFETQTSQIETTWLSNDIDSTMPLLENWGVPCRLATLAGYGGCFNGYVTELAERWLATMPAEDLARTQVFACGPNNMLKAVAKLADKYELPCQVSLEEFMACAVGGCAGCTVRVNTPEGPAMKRVCVDGPVFDAKDVIW